MSRTTPSSQIWARWRLSTKSKMVVRCSAVAAAGLASDSSALAAGAFAGGFSAGLGAVASGLESHPTAKPRTRKRRTDLNMREPLIVLQLGGERCHEIRKTQNQKR